MTPGTKSVFLSYASQDAEAARRICDALRAAGIEVWFDQSELRGGDAWDASIRNQIKACTLFVPLVSRSTHAREEGYFRLEWKLAIDRSHLMSTTRAFLLPVAIDDTLENEPGIPERFREVQWTRLGEGAPSTAFVEHVRRLLMDDTQTPAAHAPVRPRNLMEGAPQAQAASAKSETKGGGGIARWTVPGLVAAALIAVGAFLYHDRGAAPSLSSGGPAVGAFAPPPHSVAVLPFVNMSSDKQQDYFSDGLSEELLNSLVTVRDLQVAARTSSFSFKGKDVKLGDVARELNVGSVLEGSVRKDGSHVRITAQLINAVTGYHLWSQTYDRDLKDVLKLQTEIATAVTKALQATLLADAGTTIELGGTHNTQAFDAYLRGRSDRGEDRNSVLGRIANFDEAVRLDPAFAKAYSAKAQAENGFAEFYGVGPEIREHFEAARKDAEHAIALAPDLGEAHSTLARILADGFFEYGNALAEHERAIQLAPNDSTVLLFAGWYLVDIGRTEEGIALGRKGLALDQVNDRAYTRLAITLSDARQFREAVETYDRALRIRASGQALAERGLALLKLGELDGAKRDCETPPLTWENRTCLAILYEKLHRHPDAEAQVAVLVHEMGDSPAMQFAEIYAQWGDIPKALDWIEKAYRVKDPGMVWLKVDDALDPLRSQPRFQEMERKLNFPS